MTDKPSKTEPLIVRQFPEVAEILRNVTSEVHEAYRDGLELAVPQIWSNVEIPPHISEKARAALTQYLAAEAASSTVATSVLGG